MDYEPVNDYELLYLIEECNEEAYCVAYKKYHPLLDQMVYHYLGYAKKFGLEYDDLYQAGLIGLSYALSHYNERENTLFYTYARLCMKGKIINLIRVSSSKKYMALNDAYSFSYSVMDGVSLESQLSLSDDAVDEVVSRELEFLLYRFQYSLTQEMGSVYELKRNGFSISEIAILLDISVKAVSNHLYQAKKKLVVLLKKLKYI